MLTATELPMIGRVPVCDHSRCAESAPDHVANEWAIAARAHVHSRVLGLVKGLQIDNAGERLIITGRATSFYAKQMVTQATMELLPDRRISNELVVQVYEC